MWSMKLFISSVIYVNFLLLLRANSEPVDLSPNFLFGSLRNATLGATTFISNSLQKQTEMIIQAKNTVQEYVTSAVAVPTNMLNNAKEATRDYSKLAASRRIVDSKASRGMELKVRSLLEVVRSNMPYGMPLLDLPVLEPLTIEHMDIDVDHIEIGKLSCTIDNVTISQLSTFVVDDVKLSLHDGLSLALNLSVPTINAEGMYRVSGILGTLFSVNGSGPFELTIKKAKFYAHTVLGFSHKMYVKNLTIDFSIETLDAAFQNLFPDPEVGSTINQVISMMAPEMMDVIKPEMRPKLEKIIADRINAIVSRLTLGNIIAILTGTSDINSFAHLATPKLTISR